jgi:hypothetical protein
MNNNKYIVYGIIVLIVLFLLQRNCNGLIDYTPKEKKEISIDTIITKVDTIRLTDTLIIRGINVIQPPKIVYINKDNTIKNVDIKKDTFKGSLDGSDIAFLHENFINDTLFDAKISTLISPKKCQILSQNLELKLKNRYNIKETTEVKTTEVIRKVNKGRIGFGTEVNSFNMIQAKMGYNIGEKTILTGGYIRDLNNNTTGYAVGIYFQL